MEILRELIDSIDQDYPVRNVVVSTHSTLVCSLRCGMSSTTLSIKPHGEEFINEAGELHLKSARQLAQMALSENPLEASVGVAAINSAIQIDENLMRMLDAADLTVELSKNKNVVVIGHFPFIPRIKDVARSLFVIEQNPAEGELTPPFAAQVLCSADLVAITAATLINHTLEPYLLACKPDAIVSLIGPSTPLSPLLFCHHIDILSGILVEEEGCVLRAVTQGAIFKQMKGIKRLVMVKPELKQLVAELL